MQIDEFKIEQWLNPLDEGAKYNLGASCVKAFTVSELFECIGENKGAFFEELNDMSLHYGHFFGLDRLKQAIAKMYERVDPEMILTTHGGTSANSTVLMELLEPGDNVVCFVPNYQMHYSIPQSMGIEVRFLTLKLENDYLPDFEELKNLVDSNTKMIIFSSPNNPTGSFMDKEMLTQVIDIARDVDAYILSDEIYRGLSVEYMPSVVDLYEKGIVTSSTSKVFSMAGTRLGWIALRDSKTFERLENRRSYITICEGVFDELISAIAFEHFETILERSRKIVDKNRAIVDGWLATQPYLHTTAKSYSTTAFITYDYDVDVVELCTDLYSNTGVLLCHGECFDVPKSFRLGYGFGDSKMLSDGLDLLSSHLSTYSA